MVALLAGKGLALAAGKPLIAVNHLEGHALSPRLVDPDLGFPYLLLLVSGGHCQLLEVRGVGDYRRLATTIDDAAGEAFDKAAKLLGLGLSRRPGDRGAGEGRRSSGRSAAAPAGRLGRAAFLLRRPQERGAARSRLRRLTSARTSPRASSRRWSIASSTAPRWRSRRAMRPRWSSPAESPPTRRSAPRSPSLPQREGRRFSVPPGLAVHRQCGDDRLGRRRALRRRADRPLDAPARARWPLDRARREGARRGGEGMKLGVIGGGAWGTALAQVASRGRSRDPAVGARARGRRGDQRPATRTRCSSPGVPLNPAIRATARSCRSRRLRRLAGRHAGAAHARGARAGAAIATSRWCSAPRASRSSSGELLHEVAREAVPGRADRGAVRPDLRA